MTEATEIIRDILRAHMTDPLPTRVVGTNWIIDDWPEIENMTSNDFPRISLVMPQEFRKLFSLGSTSMWSTDRLQIDVWVKPDVILTVNGTSCANAKQALKLSAYVRDIIKQYAISDILLPSNYVILRAWDSYTPHKNYEYNFWRLTADVTLERLIT